MKAHTFGFAAALAALVFVCGCGGGGSTSGGPAGNGPAAPASYTSASGPLETFEGRPVIRLYGTTWCPHSAYLAGMFDSVAREYAAAGKIVARHWQMDTGDDTLTDQVEAGVPTPDRDVFSRFNPDQSIPTIVIAGRYYRIGSAYEGASNGLALEERDFRAAIEAVLREAPDWPLVTTLAATSVTSTGATLNGSAIPNGLATNAWFEWGADPSLSNPPTDNQSIGSGSAGVAVSQAITGLTPNTIYYYRIVARNSEGRQSGAIRYFVTPAGGGAGFTFDEGLATVLRGVLVDNQTASALSIPAAYFRVGEFRNFSDTTRMCITLGILRSYFESAVGESSLPREDEEWVFSQWDSSSYDSTGRTAVVRDLHGHAFAFDIRFNQPSSGMFTVVSATLDNVPVALSTQTYTTQILNSYGWSEEPAWFVPPN